MFVANVHDITIFTCINIHWKICLYDFIMFAIDYIYKYIVFDGPIKCTGYLCNVCMCTFTTSSN